MNKIDLSKLSSEDLEWMIGLYLADGFKIKEKQRHYRTHFYLPPIKDGKILEKLLKVFRILKIKPHVRHVKKINTLFVRVCNKELFEILPQKNEEFQPENKEALIAGFLDGDGYISIKEGSIGFSQTVVKWIGPFISNYLRDVGIIPWKEKYYRNAFYYRTSLKKVKEKTNIINLMVKAGEYTTLGKP